MKRIILIFILLNHLALLYSSNSIRFMGIDINGDVDTFKKELINKNFIYSDSYKTAHKFIGKFVNETVELTVLASPITNIVCKVIVNFTQKSNWEDLKKDYFKKKYLYKLKYVLESEYEFFTSPYEDGDGYEMRAVHRDKCNYLSIFLVQGGGITLSISNSAQVKVTYENSENLKKAQLELEEISLDDI